MTLTTTPRSVRIGFGALAFLLTMMVFTPTVVAKEIQPAGATVTVTRTELFICPIGDQVSVTGWVAFAGGPDWVRYRRFDLNGSLYKSTTADTFVYSYGNYKNIYSATFPTRVASVKWRVDVDWLTYLHGTYLDIQYKCV